MYLLLHCICLYAVLTTSNIVHANYIPTSDTVQTNTSSGPIIGRVTTVNGRQYAVYLNIPYAEPPVGTLRLENPVPVKSWAPTAHDATGNFGYLCPQPPFNTTYQSEDCLSLNIFTPIISDQTTDQPSPVMFWIHGGAFLLGAAAMYAETGILSNLVSRDVIVVTINYRLGALGFWTTDSEVAPGNYGLRDQILALKWVHDNIVNFGGNPDKITIFGESAGGASVSLITLAPEARGLFNQSIAQSGSAFAVWVGNNAATRYSAITAQSVGCANVTDAQSQLDCMKQVPLERFFEMMNTTETMADVMTDIPSPRVDFGLFPDTFENLATQRLPGNVMIGTTHDEAAFFYLPNPWQPSNDSNLIKTKEDVLSSINGAVNNFTFPRNAELIKKAYVYRYVNLPDAAPHNLSINPYYWFDQIVQMSSAPSFFAPAYQDAVLQVETHSNVYLYSFDYMMQMGDTSVGWRGASHGSELSYLFASFPMGQTGSSDMDPYFNASTVGLSNNDRTVETLLGELWTNFAKFGNPTPYSTSQVQWLPLCIEPGRGNFLSISESPKMLDGYNYEQIAFLNFIGELSNA